MNRYFKNTISKALFTLISFCLLSLFINTKAYAFKTVGHYVSLLDIIHDMPNSSIIRSSMEEYLPIATMGAAGPDLGYGTIMAGLGLAEWGDRMHYEKAGSFAEAQLKDALAEYYKYDRRYKESSKVEDYELADKAKKKIAWSAGWLTHITGDLACHGEIVNPYAGVYLDNTKGRTIHKNIEQWIEPILWQRYGSKFNEIGEDTYNKKNLINRLLASPDPDIVSFLRSIYNKVYLMSPSISDIESFWNQYIFGIGNSIGYSYLQYDEAVKEMVNELKKRDNLNSDQELQRIMGIIDKAMYDTKHLSLKLFAEAESGDYSEFSDSWNLDAAKIDDSFANTGVITIKTTDNKYSGTFNDIYFSIKANGKWVEYPKLVTAKGDFNKGATDIFYFYLGKQNCKPTDIEEIKLEKRKGAMDDNWEIANVKFDINGVTVLNKKNINKTLTNKLNIWNAKIDKSFWNAPELKNPTNNLEIDSGKSFKLGGIITSNSPITKIVIHKIGDKENFQLVFPGSNEYDLSHLDLNPSTFNFEPSKSYTLGIKVKTKGYLSTEANLAEINIKVKAASTIPNEVPFANILNNCWAVNYNGWIYYLNINGSICKVKPDGSNRTVIYKDSDVQNIQIVDNSIYFYNAIAELTDSKDEGLFKINLDGSQKIRITDKSDIKYYIYKDHIYFNGYDGIYRVNKNGMNEKLIIDIQSPSNIFIANDYLYFLCDSGIYRANLDGSGVASIISDNVLSFNIYNDYIYYTYSSDHWYGDDALFRAKIDGSEKTKYITPTNIHSINVNDGWIYYVVDGAQEGLYKIRIDGSDNTKLLDYFVARLNYLDNWLYYYHYDQKSGMNLYKTSVNGDITQLVN